MILATARLGIKDKDVLDITIKSGKSIGLLLAPTWDMVAGLKKSQAFETAKGQAIELESWFTSSDALTWDEYREQYHALLRHRFYQSPAPFISLLKAERAVLACYCTSAHNCHRTLAADVLGKIGVHYGMPVESIGELYITKELL